MMWVKEFSDLMDVLPYYLLICLPVFIALSPINPVEAAQELDVHRLAQFDLASNSHGSRQAALSMDARGPRAGHVLRKTIVSKMCDLSVARFRELVTSGAGGFVLILPTNIASLTGQCREAILELEQELLSSEIDVPVYFTEETPELLDLYTSLESEGEGESGQQWSAMSALLQSISTSGYQLVVSAGVPQPLKDQSLVSMSGQLTGTDSETSAAPTIAVVAHYDAGGAAPSLAFGGDSNASGVSLLLELSRLFSMSYSSTRSHPNHNLVFLLSAGGKLNYAGTKRWLEEHLDMDTTSDVLANVDFVLCLDSLGKSPLRLHVSKPPKEGSAGDKFYKHLVQVSETLSEKADVDLVHKKINLADEKLAWEHERFSIRRLPAFTLSSMSSPGSGERNTLLDTGDSVDTKQLNTHARVIAEALACSIYPKLAEAGCSAQLFSGSLAPTPESLAGWLDLVTSGPRHPSLVAGKQSDLVKTLTSALSRYTKDVTKVVTSPDRREPEYVLYDTAMASLNVYTVKPAVFDLFLSIAILAYLSVIYGVIVNYKLWITFLSSLIKESEMNGHAKTNGFKNGHKLHAY